MLSTISSQSPNSLRAEIDFPQPHTVDSIECSGRFIHTDRHSDYVEFVLGKRNHKAYATYIEITETNQNELREDDSQLIIQVNSPLDSNSESNDLEKKLEKKKLVAITVQSTYDNVLKALKISQTDGESPYDIRSVLGQILYHALGSKKVKRLHTFLLACQSHTNGLSHNAFYELPAHHLQLPYVIRINKLKDKACITLKPSPHFILPVKKEIPWHLPENKEPLEEIFDITSFKDMLMEHIKKAIKDNEMAERNFGFYIHVFSAILKYIPSHEVKEEITKASKYGTKKIWLFEKRYYKVDGQIKLCSMVDSIDCIITFRSKIFEIGEGSQKKVYKSFSLFNKKIYATSYCVVDENTTSNPPQVNILSSIFETALTLKVQDSLRHRQINHVALPSCYHFSVFGNHIHGQTETITDCFSSDLFDFIQKPTEYITADIFDKQKDLIYLEIAKKITESLLRLHELDIVHKDIKPENCVIQIENNSVVHASLIDLGLSSFEGIQRRPCGSFMYVAPETAFSIFKNNNIEIVTKISDLWSLGVVLYTLFFKKSLIDPNKITNIIQRNDLSQLENLYNYLELWIEEHITSTSPIKSILKKLLIVNPEKRSSLKSIIIELEEKIAIEAQK